ncbi:hypothetical protein C8R44DRAFT_752004 [Mycena epipterygia]|nr:hypothetical protein C8R44DRAFT_752004 [Mycena epipterygia]
MCPFSPGIQLDRNLPLPRARSGEIITNIEGIALVKETDPVVIVNGDFSVNGEFSRGMSGRHQGGEADDSERDESVELHGSIGFEASLSGSWAGGIPHSKNASSVGKFKAYSRIGYPYFFAHPHEMFWSAVEYQILTWWNRSSLRRLGPCGDLQGPCMERGNLIGKHN